MRSQRQVPVLLAILTLGCAVAWVVLRIAS